MTYETMNDKWNLGDESYEHNSDIKANKVIVLLEDQGGGICSSHVIGVSVFDSLKDFCGWLLFAEIPRIISWNAQLGDEVEHSEEKLLELAPIVIRSQVKELIGNLSEILKAGTIDAFEIGEAVDLFNDVFKMTNPSVELLAWGKNLQELIKGIDVEYMLKEDVELDDDDDEKNPIAEPLKKLLDNNEFSITNPEHLKMAVDYIESKTKY